MKNPALSLAVFAFALAAGTAHANLELAKKSGCFACHAVDKKVVGPAFKDVAAKYKGNKEAEAMLASRVKNGTVDTWGPVPMTPNNTVSDADIATLVKWVLAM
jgi:cytochrome c